MLELFSPTATAPAIRVALPASPAFAQSSAPPVVIPPHLRPQQSLPSASSSTSSSSPSASSSSENSDVEVRDDNITHSTTSHPPASAVFRRNLWIATNGSAAQATESQPTGSPAALKMYASSVKKATKSAALGDIVKLNVGGTRYCTSLSTLSSHGENFLTNLIKHYQHDVVRCSVDEEGYIFIDRNGRVFEAILEILRSGELILPPGVTARQVELELDFYQICFPNASTPSGKARASDAEQRADDDDDDGFRPRDSLCINPFEMRIFNAWQRQFSRIIVRLDQAWDAMWSSLLEPDSCCIDGDAVVFLVLYPSNDRDSQQLVFVSHHAHSSFEYILPLGRHAFNEISTRLGSRVLWFPMFFSKYIETRSGGVAATVSSRSGGSDSLSMMFHGWVYHYFTCRIPVPARPQVTVPPSLPPSSSPGRGFRPGPRALTPSSLTPSSRILAARQAERDRGRRPVVEGPGNSPMARFALRETLRGFRNQRN